MDRFVTQEPLSIEDVAAGEEFSGADLIFLDVDHSGPSWEGRVFFNNPDATLETSLDEAQGYAGSFFVFGHGRCYGEEGHCDPEQRFTDEFDLRLPHPLTPITRTIDVADALARVEDDTLTVTVVAAEHEGEEAAPSDAMEFSEIRLLTYEK
jgi:hypothetical protein